MGTSTTTRTTTSTPASTCKCKNAGCAESGFLAGDGGIESDCTKQSLESGCCGQTNFAGHTFCVWGSGCAHLQASINSGAHNIGTLLSMLVADMTAFLGVKRG